MIERHDVEWLSEVACKIDEMKNRFPQEEHRRLLADAIFNIHLVATLVDAANNFGLYQAEGA